MHREKHSVYKFQGFQVPTGGVGIYLLQIREDYCIQYIEMESLVKQIFQGVDFVNLQLLWFCEPSALEKPSLCLMCFMV